MNKQNGVILDNFTNLMWQQNGKLSGRLSWYNARIFCKKLKLAGFRNWRLPKVKELRTLFSGYKRPVKALNSFGFKNIADDFYWSGNHYKYNRNYALHMRMYDGYVHCSLKSNKKYVLAVREGR